MSAPAQAAKRGNGEAKKPLPAGESAFALLERDLPEPARWCDPWCAEGVNIIASRPKLGKTTLGRQKAAALAGGAEFLGSACKQTRALILSLEEGERLMRTKFKRAGFPEAALGGITLFFEWPRGWEGVDLLKRYLAENTDIGYVCIDSLSRFRAVPDAKTPAFTCDYEAMSMLNEMSKEFPGRAIDVIHHTRKAKSDDAIDDISGTYGLSAACDSYTVLRHHTDGAVMYCGGRLWDRDASEFQLRRGKQRWELVGEYNQLAGAQEETLARVKLSGGLSPSELAKQIGVGRQSAWERLSTLEEKGLLKRKREGKSIIFLPLEGV